jgi:hypothetical protein
MCCRDKESHFEWMLKYEMRLREDMMSRPVILSGASFPAGALICLLLYSGDALSAVEYDID